VTTENPASDASSARPDPAHTGTERYEIRVKGHLGPRWTAWFDELSLSTHDDGTTVIEGPIADQAALHGLLQKLRDLGIPLVSLTQIPPDTTATQKGN
jgi:hypothetical protein